MTSQETEILHPLDYSYAPRSIDADISVVIPTLGRPILESCLHWLANGTRWPGRLIVVDQGRNPAVAAWLARLDECGLPTLYVPSPETGRSAGLNRGLERVETRFAAMTDDDCFVAPDWLEQMDAALRAEPGAIVTGRVELAGNPEDPFSVVTSRERKRYVKPQLKVHPFIGGNAGLAMGIVRRVGPFDEHPCLASAEDNDFGYRALRLGIPIRYEPDIVLFHYHWRDAGQRAARYADYARSQGGFYGTHLRRGDWLIFAQTVRALARSPIRWLRGIVARDRDLAANGRAHTLYLPQGIIAGWRRSA